MVGSTYDMLLDMHIGMHGSCSVVERQTVQLDMHYKYQPFCTKMYIFNLYYSNFGKFAPFIYYLYRGPKAGFNKHKLTCNDNYLEIL